MDLSEEIYKEFRFIGEGIPGYMDDYAKELSSKVAQLEAELERFKTEPILCVECLIRTTKALKQEENDGLD